MIVGSCLDKTFWDRLSYFEECWSSLLRLLMALQKSLLRIDKASLLETCGSLKIRNFGYTPSCLQLLGKSEEHIKKDSKSDIFKHHSTATCFDSYNSLCFKIIEKANPKFNLKIKEALHINWRKPNLNGKKGHLALTL